MNCTSDQDSFSWPVEVTEIKCPCVIFYGEVRDTVIEDLMFACLPKCSDDEIELDKRRGAIDSLTNHIAAHPTRVKKMERGRAPTLKLTTCMRPPREQLRLSMV